MIRLRYVREIVKECISDCDELEARSLIKDDRTKSPEHAQLSSTLLHLADELALAAALVRREYWRESRGYMDDPTVVPMALNSEMYPMPSMIGRHATQAEREAVQRSERP